MLLATDATDTERLLLALGVIIIVGPLLATRLRLPGLIGLVLGGTLVGANGLGVLEPGEIDGLGDIGLLYLMFTAGLELDLVTFARYRSAAIGFGMTTFLLPFLCGMGAGFILDYEPEAAILIGSIWASHTLVAYPEARQAGLAANRAVTTVVGATALTDTLALIVLAVIAATQEGGSPGATVATLAVGVVVVGGRPCSSTRVSGGGSSPTWPVTASPAGPCSSSPSRRLPSSPSSSRSRAWSAPSSPASG